MLEASVKYMFSLIFWFLDLQYTVWRLHKDQVDTV